MDFGLWILDLGFGGSPANSAAETIFGDPLPAGKIVAHPESKIQNPKSGGLP